MINRESQSSQHHSLERWQRSPRGNKPEGGTLATRLVAICHREESDSTGHGRLPATGTQLEIVGMAAAQMPWINIVPNITRRITRTDGGADPKLGDYGWPSSHVRKRVSSQTDNPWRIWLETRLQAMCRLSPRRISISASMIFTSVGLFGRDRLLNLRNAHGKPVNLSGQDLIT